VPLYEFQCQDCRKTFEVIVKSSSGEGKMLFCPGCQSRNLKKQISLSSFSLKGGGWAKDGYGS
jgi:putative FmdB family regulatory protein